MKVSKKTNFGFTIACMLIVAVGILTQISISQLEESTKSVLHTTEVKLQLDELHLSHISSLSNLRAYYLRNEKAYLDNYEIDQKNIPEILNRIEFLTKDNSQQQLEIKTLRAMLESRRTKAAQSIELFKRQGIAAVLKRADQENIPELNIEINNRVSQMKEAEDLLQKGRQEKTEKNISTTSLILLLGAFFALIIIIIASYISHRDSKKREIAEQEMDRFFTLSLDMLCISGMDGYFKRLSPAFQSVLGYSLQELYSKPILDFIHPEDIQKTTAEIEKQASGKQVMAFENRFRCKDGKYKLLSWKSAPQDGMMYAVARDVTKQKEFERQLFVAQEMSQQATKAKTEFVANVSHEIRTPLNAIVGVVDLLKDTPLNLDQQKLLDVIRISGSGLLKTINEVLDFSKIESGKMEVENIGFDVRQLIESQISLSGITAHEKKLFLSFSIDPLIPNVAKGDSNKISQIMGNLLNNAIKFTNKGAVALNATLLEKNEHQMKLRFEIVDSGIGITPQQLEKLFSPFTQADGSTARKFGGTGLGLSISKRLVEMMGGEIGAKSEVGRGTTFWFTITLGILNQDELVVKPALMATNNLKEALNLKVLVAEDNPVNQMIVTKMLEKLGCQTRVVNNGKEALDFYSKEKFDIILMDQHMPSMNGTEAALHIRNLEKNSGKRVPIIAFTANIMMLEQKENMGNAIDDVVLKPVTLEILEKALRRWSPRVK